MGKPSQDDITGNRFNHPNLSTRFSSAPSRTNTLSDAMGGDGNNPFGCDNDYSFFVDDDNVPKLDDEVTFFNSRLDLVDDLPSTVGNRFVCQNR